MQNYNDEKRAVVILGASGSIGQSALAVLSLHPEQFSLYAVSANTNVTAMTDICCLHQPRFAVMVDEAAGKELSEKLKTENCNTVVLTGHKALEEVASADETDLVVAGIVGAAGLSSCFAAARSGKKILIANKESIVVAGNFLLQVVRENNAEIIPLDSEHNAIFQCHPLAHNNATIGANPVSVRKIFLTASGGPFLDRDLDSFERITPEEACAHPRWKMGRKISVDSATMMNKGLELIEASLLFGLEAEEIDVLVHPQSIVHSMVEYIDGSVLAQLGTADMRIPIAYALGFPNRLVSGANSLSAKDLSLLEFREPCELRFPALVLARQAAEEGKVLPVILNAANEICVDSFLQSRISFTSIAKQVEEQMQSFSGSDVSSLEDILELDRQVRVATLDAIS